MENGYPIKYALMPIYEQVGWTQGRYELESDYEMVCYIVSKCYIVSEEKRYHDNGSYRINYQVVFPFERDNYSIWVRQEPSINYYGQCSNGIILDQIFESVNLALSVKKEKNRALLNEKIALIHYDENYKEKYEETRKNFLDKLDYYEQLENEIRNLIFNPNRQINSIDLANGVKNILYYENNEPHIKEEEMQCAKVKIKQ